MAATKNKKSPSRSGKAFAAVLENMRRDFQVFGGALASLRAEIHERFDGVNARFEAVDVQFEAVDARFEGASARFDDMSRRFDRVDGRLDRLETDMGLVKIAILETRREMKEALGRKVDREELAALGSLAR